jgi:hypothetical protein
MKNPMRGLFQRHKSNKFLYYATGAIRLIFPAWICRTRLTSRLSGIHKYDREYLLQRVNYYNKLDRRLPVPEEAQAVGDFRVKNKLNTYFFDCYEHLRYFDPALKLKFVFGDVDYGFKEPTIVKSRPISDNSMSVLLKLNKIRHFIYTSDRKPYAEKKDLLVFRGAANRQNRITFLQKYYEHPLCNLGQPRKKNKPFFAERLTIEEQLDYKFILSLEGNDVASNLKWIMSSNSLAVMPRPKYETWFMEGTLVPDEHYVVIKDDYSDLEERLAYFLEHPDKAQRIIKNANQYVSQFKCAERESLLSLLVLEKYFYMTGQKNINPAVKEFLQL